MGLVLASMWALARLKVQGREPPAWGSAHRKGQQDAMGTRRHLSNNKPGGQADRTQGASFRSPSPLLSQPSRTQRSLQKSTSPTLTQFSILKSAQIAQR